MKEDWASHWRDPLLALIPTCCGDVIRVIGAVRMERLVGNEMCVASGLVKALSLESACLHGKQEQGSDPSKIRNHHWSKSGTPDRHARTGPVIGVTSPGVVIGSCPKRPPDSTRWNTDALLRGLLWKLPLRSRDRPENRAEGAAPALPLQSLQVSKKVSTSLLRASTGHCQV